MTMNEVMEVKGMCCRGSLYGNYMGIEAPCATLLVVENPHYDPLT